LIVDSKSVLLGPKGQDPLSSRGPTTTIGKIQEEPRRRRRTERSDVGAGPLGTVLGCSSGPTRGTRLGSILIGLVVRIRSTSYNFTNLSLNLLLDKSAKLPNEVVLKGLDLVVGCISHVGLLHRKLGHLEEHL